MVFSDLIAHIASSYLEAVAELMAEAPTLRCWPGRRELALFSLEADTREEADDDPEFGHELVAVDHVGLELLALGTS